MTEPAARALQAWSSAIERGEDRAGAAERAAVAVADDPWAVVEHAGALARASSSPAPRDTGLTARWRRVSVDHADAVIRVGAGTPLPEDDRPLRKQLGAFDTPREMARQLARLTLLAAARRRSGLDPACGSGALLLALREAGVVELRGSDLDPAVARVAAVALPGADIRVADALESGPVADVVVGNPPFVPAERQGAALRKRLEGVFPWLEGRYDLAVPVAARMAERVAPGGALGLVAPVAIATQPYGAALRRRWLASDRIVVLEGPSRFPGAAVDVCLMVIQPGQGPATVGGTGIHADVLLQLRNAPLDPELRVGDVELVARVRTDSISLGSFCRVDTGVVSHGPLGGKARLLHDEPGPGRVRYADAREVFDGRHRWLDYRPDEMHRAKDRDLFEGPKLIVQRIRGRGPVRVVADRSGLFVGHTCTVVRHDEERVPLERLAELVGERAVAGLLRVERGWRLDLYPRDVASMPVPDPWPEGASWAEAMGLDSEELSRLRVLGGA